MRDTCATSAVVIQMTGQLPHDLDFMLRMLNHFYTCNTYRLTSCIFTMRRSRSVQSWEMRH